MEEQTKINGISEELVFGQEYVLADLKVNARYSETKGNGKPIFIGKRKCKGSEYICIYSISKEGFVVKGNEIIKVSNEGSFKEIYFWDDLPLDSMSFREGKERLEKLTKSVEI